jgi:hypothetical protein
VVEISPSTGPGFLQGYVIEGPGYGRAQGDPVHGVIVKRGITGSSQIMETTTTAVNGEYHFSNVPVGNYTIYVDIPGLERDSVYDVVVTAVNNQFLNLYYVVDSNSIYIVPGIGVEDFSSDPNTLSLYPNPVSQNTRISYSIFSEGRVQLELFNVLGTKLTSLVNTTLSPGEYTYDLNTKGLALKPGIYFISLSVNGKRKTCRLVVID